MRRTSGGAPNGPRTRCAASDSRTSSSSKPPATPSSTATGCRRPGAPTILFYGHYDVQPVDPLELWESPPFEATVRDGEIYARGAADDKGQVFMHLKAIEAHLKKAGKLPVNIKVIVEGEEEVGSKQPRRVRPRQQADARRRCRRDFRLGHVRPGRAVDLLFAARARRTSRSISGARRATCTPACSAAPSPTPPWCSRRSWRR